MESLRALIKKNQKVALGIAAAFILFAIYNTFLKDTTPDVSVSGESRSINDLPTGRNIVATLNRLKTIEIDPQVLEDDLFVRLFDFSKPLPDYVKGKQNPFAEEIPAFGDRSITEVGQQETGNVLQEAQVDLPTDTGEAN